LANALFDKGRENFLTGNIAWSSATIKVFFVDGTDDTPVAATDDALDDILAAGRVPALVANHPTLGTKTATNGVADAADSTFTALTGDPVEYLLIYKDSGTESTSYLAVLIDTATGLNPSLTPNGGDVIVQWDNGANKIFKL
jgi:hypothetical protein